MAQLYKVYYYLLDLRVAYSMTLWQALKTLLALGSEAEAPYRLVLRSSANVDYSQLPDSLGDKPEDLTLFSQVCDALVGNDVLKRLILGTHQLSPERMKALAQALRGNSHLKEIIIVESGGMLSLIHI